VTSADCPTCGGEFHSVRLREEAIEYALSALGKESHGELCAGCKKVVRRTEAVSVNSHGSEGVVVET